MGTPDELALHHEASVRAANEALASMRDKQGRWWLYSVSLGTFDLVVGNPLGNDNIALCLAACEYIAGPTEWPKQKLEVLWNANKPTEFVLQDQSVGFKAVGKVFSWKRNFDLLKHRSLHLGPDIGV